MIVRVTGKVDGRDVVFERSSGDSWQVTVPVDLDGVYVIEVTAVNDRGLVAYRTKMLLTVDPSALRISLVPMEWNAELIDMKLRVEVIYPRR